MENFMRWRKVSNSTHYSNIQTVQNTLRRQNKRPHRGRVQLADLLSSMSLRKSWVCAVKLPQGRASTRTSMKTACNRKLKLVIWANRVLRINQIYSMSNRRKVRQNSTSCTSKHCKNINRHLKEVVAEPEAHCSSRISMLSRLLDQKVRLHLAG